ncbi:uncharacterized protein B0H64DRAFT_449068 [Chaetomium fimeti]|uniref:Uncharacterized protein n=1 Tax=Chaetomium fimeti TaxID=1854472 RepID=A0AAE0HQ96_9PEZI|nr:hypothetical protein B0H64DRAFT_449068 [Chaetomium fimeti]
MAPTPNNTQFTYSPSSIMPLDHPTAALSELIHTPAHEETTGHHRTASRSRSHRRNPYEGTGLLDDEQFSRPTDAPSHGRHHHTEGTLPLRLATPNAFSGSSSSSRPAATVSHPEAHWDGGRYESAGSGVKRRYRGAFAGQGPSDPNAASAGYTAKAQERGSTTTAAVLGSGSGSSSSGRGVSSSGGLRLTEENVRRTSSFYECVRRDSAGQRGESSGRRASLLATLEEAGSKLSGGARR